MKVCEPRAFVCTLMLVAETAVTVPVTSVWRLFQPARSVLAASRVAATRVLPCRLKLGRSKSSAIAPLRLSQPSSRKPR